MSFANETIGGAPELAMPYRPKRPASAFGILKTARRNSLAICDEELFEELIVERRYFHQRVFFVSDPAGIKRVLVDNFMNYTRWEVIRRILEPTLGTGLLTNEGETWQRHRPLIGPIMDHRTLLADFPLLTELIEELERQWSARDPDDAIDVGRQLAVLVMFFSCFMIAGRDPQMVALMNTLSKYPRPRRLLDFLPGWMQWLQPRDTMKADVGAYESTLRGLIAARRHDGYDGGHDLLWRLANARDRDTGELLNEREVRDEAATLVFGGVDATTRALTWTWYLLAMHPWAESKLHAELESVLGGRRPGFDDLIKLTFLRRLIDESLRLYPPIPVLMRRAVADDVICGRPVPRGSLISIMPYVVHRHRRLWDDPDRFDPDRFAPENVRGRSRYAFMPFSVGPRNCVGASLAMIEIPTIIASLAQRFRLRLVPGHPVDPVGWITLRPNHGIKATIEKRG